MCVLLFRSYSSYLAVIEEAVVPARNGHVKNLLSRQARRPGGSSYKHLDTTSSTTKGEKRMSWWARSRRVQPVKPSHHQRNAQATQPNSPPAIVNNLGRSRPNQEHQITYQPQLRMGYAIARSTAKSCYHLAIGKARGTKSTNTARILTAVVTPGVHERRPEENYGICNYRSREHQEGEGGGK